MPPKKSKKPAPSPLFGNEPASEDAKKVLRVAHAQLEERDRNIRSLSDRLANLEAGYALATRALNEASIMAGQAQGLGDEKFRKDASRWKTYFDTAVAQIRNVVDG